MTRLGLNPNERVTDPDLRDVLYPVKLAPRFRMTATSLLTSSVPACLAWLLAGWLAGCAARGRAPAAERAGRGRAAAAAVLDGAGPAGLTKAYAVPVHDLVPTLRHFCEESNGTSILSRCLLLLQICDCHMLLCSNIYLAHTLLACQLQWLPPTSDTVKKFQHRKRIVIACWLY